MTRRCSHCTQNGHNSRTCPNRGSGGGVVKLFGVRITDGSIRKSASMGNLTHLAAGSGSGRGNQERELDRDDGYASDDLVVGSSSSSRDKKKGTPWTEEEHRMFLRGLNKLGKGDWRGISRNYVISKTPTQVASHAQKFFIRQSNVGRRKRRSSLFDIVPDEPRENPVPSQDFPSVEESQTESKSNNSLPTPAPRVDEEFQSMDSSNSNYGEPVNINAESSMACYPMMNPAYFAPFYPYSISSWSGYNEAPTYMKTHEVVKPTAVHSKCPINVDELVGMSKLSLGESIGNFDPSSLSLKLSERPRQSAFHA